VLQVFLLTAKLILHTMDHKRYMSQIGKIGGIARAAKLSPERRKEIAIKGANTRKSNQEAKNLLASQVANGTYNPRYDESKQSLQ